MKEDVRIRIVNISTKLGIIFLVVKHEEYNLQGMQGEAK